MVARRVMVEPRAMVVRTDSRDTSKRVDMMNKSTDPDIEESSSQSGTSLLHLFSENPDRICKRLRFMIRENQRKEDIEFDFFQKVSSYYFII